MAYGARVYREATHSRGLFLLHLLPRDRGVDDRCPYELCGRPGGMLGFRVAEGNRVSVVIAVVCEKCILV
jgi:hypothetical protein